MNDLIAKCMSVDENPYLCIQCGLVIEGMEKNGYSDLVTEFQELREKICNLKDVDVHSRFDALEVISSIMKQLGKNGKIERIVFQALEREFKRSLSGPLC
jgi:hypothetical protein